MNDGAVLVTVLLNKNDTYNNAVAKFVKAVAATTVADEQNTKRRWEHWKRGGIVSATEEKIFSSLVS